MSDTARDDHSPTKSADGAASPGIARRAVLQGLLTGLGAVSVPGLSEAQHPMREHLLDASRVELAEQKARAKGAQPEFLDAYQFAALESLAELIIPGAALEHSAEFIDRLLVVDSQEHQRRFLSALGAFEGQARLQHGKPWSQLTVAEQNDILEAASTGEQSQPKPTPWTTGQPVTYTPPSDPPPPATLRDHFEHLRGWVSGAYYSTERGMRELGWTGNLFFTKLDGCDHPDSHAG
jgi:hypothetical protein